MQQRLQEQQSSAALSEASPAMTAVHKKTGPAAITRSSSASALPSPTTGSGASTGAATPTQPHQHLSGSSTTSPYFPQDLHLPHLPEAGPNQLRSTTHSPAFLAKFHDADHPHRLPGTMANVPWLSLPGAAAAATSSGAESPTMFGRRRSDVGLHSGKPSSGTSTPGRGGLEAVHLHDSLSLLSLQQENPQPSPPQPQHHSHHHAHHHHQHLLSPPELAALGRNNTPLPLNEALPHYLRSKNSDSLHAMERSRSSPGSHLMHATPASSFMVPIASASLSASASHVGAPTGHSPSHITSPSHLLFPFSGSQHSTGRLEMERASSTGVLPVNRPTQQHRHHHHSHLGTNIGASASAGNLGSGAGKTTGASSAASFFRTSNPSAITGFGGGGAAAGFGSPFGHSSDRDLPSNKEVHA
ncbi:hypothetical protein EC968_003336 [Mortierella alpina]|nr:hypothetical protein EC968_003336 [Mortierella alpina]